MSKMISKSMLDNDISCSGIKSAKSDTWAAYMQSSLLSLFYNLMNRNQLLIWLPKKCNSSHIRMIMLKIHSYIY